MSTSDVVNSLFGLSGVPEARPTSSLLIGEGVKRWAPVVDQNLAQYPNVDRDLVYGVMQQESGGRENALSSAGAYGLMQLMEATAESLGVDRSIPEQNINGGIKLLSQLLTKYNGDKKKALAAYNWGESGLDNAIAKYGMAWDQHLPEETTDYVRRIGSTVKIEASPEDKTQFISDLFALNPKQLSTEVETDQPHLPSYMTDESGKMPESVENKLPNSGKMPELEMPKFSTAPADVRGGTGLNRDIMEPPEAVAARYQGIGEAESPLESFLQQVESAAAYREDPEALTAGRFKANPVASTLGTGVGMVAPALIGGQAAVKGAMAIPKVAQLVAKYGKTGKLAFDALSRMSIAAGDYTIRNHEELTSKDERVRNKALAGLAATAAASAVSVAPEILKSGWWQPILQGITGGATNVAAQAVTGENPLTPEAATNTIFQTVLGGAFGLGSIKAPAAKPISKPLVEGEPVGQTLPQAEAEAQVRNAYTDKITAGQEAELSTLNKELRNSRENRRSAVESGMYPSTEKDWTQLPLYRQIQEKYGDVRPTKNQVKADFKLTREKAGKAINDIYGKVEANAEGNGAQTQIGSQEEGAIGQAGGRIRLRNDEENRMAPEQGENARPVSEVKGEPASQLPSPEGATNPASGERPVLPERRKDFVKRKRIEELTEEEAKAELKYDALTGLKSRRAWEDETPQRTQGIVDVDGLKWVNDNLGYESGDELLKAVSNSLKESGVDAFRIGGDEVRFQDADEISAADKMKKAYNILKDKKIVATLPDGSTVEWKGLGFSYGSSTAESLSPAHVEQARSRSVENLHSNKSSRVKQGFRAERGEEPPGISRIPAAGNKAESGIKPDVAEDFDYTRAKQAGEGGFIRLGDGPPEENNASLSRQDTRTQVKNAFIDLFKSGGHLPESVQKADLERRGFINEQTSKISFALSDFNKAKKAAFKSKKITSADEFAINEALSGQKPIEDLPESLRAPVTAMREHIDALSNEFIRRGIVGENLAVKFKEGIGFYLNRSYRAWDDPKWYKKVPRETVNKARALLKQEMPDASDAEIQGSLEELLFKHVKDRPGHVFEAVGKLGSKNLSILKKRGEIPTEIRALWGEYKNADVNYARSVSKMSNLIANHEFLKSIKETGLKEGWLHENPVATRDASYSEKIASDKSKTLEPLNGLYTSPEIKAAFENQFSDASLPGYLKLYMKGIAASRFGKTVLSPITHVRNLTGNTLIAVANGHLRADKLGTAFKDTFSDFTKLAGPEQRARIQYLRKIGLIGESVNAGELRDIIKDATHQDIEDFVGNGGKRIRGAGRVAEKLYGLEDDLWKIYAFENEKVRYAKARPDLKGEDLDRFVVDIIRDTYPTYSKIPKIAQALRKFPFTGTFVSFPAEIIRTGIGIARQVGKEIRSDNPAIRAIGWQRFAGAMAAGSIPIAAGVASRLMSGTTQKEENEMRTFLPDWSKSSELMVLDKAEDGKIHYIDIGYTDPYSYLKKPLIAAVRGEDVESSVVQAAAEALNPFFGEDILTGKVEDVLRNKKKSGGLVYDKSSSPAQIAFDVAQHLSEGVEPGIIAQSRRFIKAARGESTGYGQPYELKTEAASLSGLRIATLDIPKSLEFKARAYRSALAEVGSYQASKNRKDLNSQIRLNEDMGRSVTAARNLGLTDADITGALKKGGMSEIAIETLLSGKENALYAHVTSENFKPSLADAKAIWRESGSPGSWRQFYRQYQKATLRIKDPELMDLYKIKDEDEREEAINSYIDKKGVSSAERDQAKRALRRNNTAFNEFLKLGGGIK